MKVSIEVEDSAWAALPGLEELARNAVQAALAGADVSDSETVVLFTDDIAMAGLNAEWRGRNSPTNVLSFPAPPDMTIPEGELRPLGDIVLASGVVAREAREQGKSLRDHTAHLIVHGVLHLVGHDHVDETQAAEMERLETDILKGLGVPDPYER
jgi:probable rRNA maturation factor